MKRFTALLVAVITYLAACSAWGAWAEETAALVGTPGETVEIRFVVTANSNNAVAATIALEYKHTTLKLIPGGDFPNENGQAVLVDLKGIPVGKEVVATFRVSGSAKQKEIPITVNVLEAGDINENQVDGLEFSSCSFQIDYIVPVFGLTATEFAQRAEEIWDACNQWEGGYYSPSSEWQASHPGITPPYPDYESFPLPLFFSSESECRKALKEIFHQSQDEFCMYYSPTTNRLIKGNNYTSTADYNMEYLVSYMYGTDNSTSDMIRIIYNNPTDHRYICWFIEDAQCSIMIDSLEQGNVATGGNNHAITFDLASGALIGMY